MGEEGNGRRGKWEKREIGEGEKREKGEEELDVKALMVIGSLCPISVEGVIRGLRWRISQRDVRNDIRKD